VYRDWAAHHGFKCVPATAKEDMGYYYGGQLAMYGLYALWTLLLMIPLSWMLPHVFPWFMVNDYGLFSSHGIVLMFFAFCLSRIWFRGSTLECYLMVINYIQPTIYFIIKEC
jgi:sensor histidine kinase YesM